MQFFSCKKSGLRAAFFALQILFTSASGATLLEVNSLNVAERLKEAAMTKRIYQLPIWSALLHAKNDRSNIMDANFLLSLPDFSSVKELQQTIDFLYQGVQGNVCRFPARYLWLRQQLDAPELPLDVCPEVAEFRQKAPLDEIALVFAGENIAQPASMLGHAFLKFSGKNEQGQEISHAISFFTDANTINLPKLLFDSMVIGKKGYFSLAPYSEKQQLYVDEEQRAIWEYQLTLDNFQKELMRLHLLELKQSHLTYFFQKYNCATLLNFILALSGKSVPDSAWWVTPKGLIKNAHQAGLIGNTRVITPSRWLARALAEQVPVVEKQSIHQQVQAGIVASNLDHSGSEAAFIRLNLAQAYSQYAYLTGKLDKSLWLINGQVITEVKTQYFQNMSLSTGNRYNPINTPGESQISFSTQYDDGEPALTLTVLPVSHALSDDNRNYTNETSLQLFATTIKWPLQNGRPILDRLAIYDVQSLMPYDEFTGGISGRIYIAVEPQKNSQLEASHVFAISGAIGFTKRVVQDVDLYSLAGGGVGYTGAHGFLYTTLEAGAVLREVWDMKSLLSLTRTINQIDSGSHYYTLSLKHSKYITNSLALNLDWKSDFNARNRKSFAAIGLRKIF